MTNILNVSRRSFIVGASATGLSIGVLAACSPKAKDAAAARLVADYADGTAMAAGIATIRAQASASGRLQEGVRAKREERREETSEEQSDIVRFRSGRFGEDSPSAKASGTQNRRSRGRRSSRDTAHPCTVPREAR